MCVTDLGSGTNEKRFIAAESHELIEHIGAFIHMHRVVLAVMAAKMETLLWARRGIVDEDDMGAQEGPPAMLRSCRAGGGGAGGCRAPSRIRGQ